MKRLLGKLMFILVLVFPLSFSLLFPASAYAISGKYQFLKETIEKLEVKVKEKENQNQPPIIINIVANPAKIFLGSSSLITCTAYDPDNDKLYYTWIINAGTFSGSGSQIRYTAIPPQTEGTYTIFCKVSDGKNISQASVDIVVKLNIPTQKKYLHGIAMGSNTGPINFEGVVYDPVTHFLSGKTQAGTITGTLSFNEEDVKNPPVGLTILPKIRENGKLIGWAKFIDKDEWLCLSADTVNSIGWGVEYNFQTEKFSGYSWSDEFNWIEWSGVYMTMTQ